MSTSDQDPTADFTERVRPALPVDETTIAPMGSLPDVAMLSPAGQRVFPRAAGAGLSYVRGSLYAGCQRLTKDLTPAFETRLPEFGMPLPSVPAIPSAGGFPLAPNASQLSTGVPELAPFTMGPAAAMSLAADRACSGSGHAAGGRRVCRKMTRAVQEPGFLSLPLPCRCLSLARRFRRLKQVCRRSRLFPHS